MSFAPLWPWCLTSVNEFRYKYLSCKLLRMVDDGGKQRIRPNPANGLVLGFGLTFADLYGRAGLGAVGCGYFWLS